jgi:NTE family protein
VDTPAVTIAILFLAASPPPAAAPPPTTPPRVCIALSGGGARGLAHIGVLQALEAEGVPIDCVAGTSMGALVGGLYAAGYTPAAMETIVRSLEWQDVFSGKPERRLIPLALRVDDPAPLAHVALRGGRIRLPPARDSDYRTNRLLFRLLAESSFRARGDFDALRRPFRAVATDLGNGQRVVLERGSVPRAVRASLSTPVNLVPVPLDGRLLVDGGLVDNLPVGVARALGADVVLAVDVQSPPLAPRPTDSFVDTTAVVVNLLMRARNEQGAEAADVTIDLKPALAGLRDVDYARHPEAVEIGRREGRRAAAGSLARLREGEPAVVPGGNGTSSRPSLEGPSLEGATVSEVAVRGSGRVRPSVVRRAFGLEPGRPFVMDEALRGMDDVYATRLFESVWVDAAPAADGGAMVTVDVQETPRITLEVGGGYDEADNARGFLRVRNRNLFGRGERSDTTLLASDAAVGLRTTFTAERPLGLPIGVFTRGHVIEDKPRVFAGGIDVGRAEFDRSGLAAGLQHGLGRAGLLRVGLATGTVRTRERPGVPFPARRDRLRSVFGEAAWDTLDDPAVPARGAAARAFAERAVSALGASRSYWHAGAHLQAAASPHRRLLLRGQALVVLSGRDLPVYEQVRIGGPLWLPGSHREEVWGGQALAASATAGVSVYRRLRALARFGAGNAWDARSAVSLGDLEKGFGLGLELPTRAGPLTLDWGRSTAGASRVYISLGFPWMDALRP